MNEKKISADILNKYQLPQREQADKLLAEEAEKSSLKIIVLDDDPTGVQTVHDVSVYTDWSVESMREGFAEKNKLFFVLTNSRGFTEEETIKAHREIVNNHEPKRFHFERPFSSGNQNRKRGNGKKKFLESRR